MQHDSIVTLKLKVERHEPGMGRRPYRVICFDGTGFVTLVYFNVKGDYLQRLLPVGAERIVSGKVEFYGGIPQIAHPDHVVAPDQADRIKPIEPIYPLTAGLPPRVLQRAIATAVERAPELPEWIDPAAAPAAPMAELERGDRRGARAAERGRSVADDRRRASASPMTRSSPASSPSRWCGRGGSAGAAGSSQGTGALATKVEAGFGFALTQSQRMAMAEIAADMKAPQQMMRLLQGDVGSGKTVVALLAMLIAVESGAQAALMAPTEVLARQHHATLQRLAAPAGIEVGAVDRARKGRPREALLAGLASGIIPIVVGTHALLTTDVLFRDLALAVIDEQHRFGVEQRLALSEKGKNADTLLMSATPIPRTLMMTAYGDLDTSRLVEKPPGRQKIDTRAVPLDRLGEVVEAVARAIGAAPRSIGSARWSRRAKPPTSPPPRSATRCSRRCRCSAAGSGSCTAA